MTNTTFTRYIAEAKARGDRETARRITDERYMASIFLDVCLKRGFTISVHDSEEWTLRDCTDKATILDAMFTSDDDTIAIRKEIDGKRMFARFWFVYGNSGEELIADHSDNETGHMVWDALEWVRNRLER